MGVDRFFDRDVVIVERELDGTPDDFGTPTYHEVRRNHTKGYFQPIRARFAEFQEITMGNVDVSISDMILCTPPGTRMQPQDLAIIDGATHQIWGIAHDVNSRAGPHHVQVAVRQTV